MSKWTAIWGNATSITERREGNYAKNLTLRYSLRPTLDGSKIRVKFSNICGNEPVYITKAYASAYIGDSVIDDNTSVQLTFNGMSEGEIAPGGEIVSDEIDFCCRAGEDIAINMYFEKFTQLMSSVFFDSTITQM